jgi:hypothetical protein
MDIYHRFEKEEDGPVWVEENKIRIAGMRSLIKRMFDTDVYFVPNHMKGAQGYLKEMAREPFAQIDMTAAKAKSPNIKFVSYNLEEKYQFNRMIFNFLFPKLSTSMAANENQLNAMAVLVVDAAANDQTLIQKANNAWTSLKNIFAGPQINFVQAFRLAREDITQSRLIPNEKNKFYAVPSLLQRQISAKVFKPLMSNQEIEQLAAQK